MEPLRFKVGPDGKVVAEFRDPASFFEEADRLFREKKYEEALLLYDRILAAVPPSKYRWPSLYNSGLVLEKLARYEEAVSRYRAAIDLAPKSPDAVDAHFRLGESLGKLKRWREAADLFTQLLLRDDLKPVENFEARVRIGVAHAETGEDDEAERALLRAVRYHAEASRVEPLGDPALLGQAFFYLGDVARRRMAAHPLRLPQEQLEQDLNEKGRLLLASQARYLSAVRTADSNWAPAAGHQLGLVYERFHDDILAAPVPPQLTALEREVYLAELTKKLLPLIRKAVGIYQRNLALSERLGAQSPWVAQTRERLEKLQRLLERLEKQPPPAGGSPSASGPAPAADKPGQKAAAGAGKAGP
jgi:tetratricopeptide (TPR) repeat protein